MVDNPKYIWQYRGFDNGICIHARDTKWYNLNEYKSNICETSYLNGDNQAISNSGEYQYKDLQKNEPYYYVIDFAFVSDEIPLRRITIPKGL